MMATVAWWQTPHWRERLQNHLWYRSRQRYTLELSHDPPLGATDPRRRIVHVQPNGIPFPTDSAVLAQIRAAPRSRLRFQRAVTWVLLEHESAHIRFSGRKPHGELLGWLWNVLEDHRIERLMAQLYPDLGRGFIMLGDAVWTGLPMTSDLLDGCLYRRFEGTRPAHQWKFHPTPAESLLWDQSIFPLVQRAWMALDSDEVVAIASDILRLLGRDEQAHAPSLPLPLCGCGGGDAHHAPTVDASAPDPLPADGMFPVMKAGRGAGHDVANPAQSDPEALLQATEGFARRMARDLRPAQPHRFPRPHPSQGELVLDRVLAGSQHPFDALLTPGPARSMSIMAVADQSRSMARGHLIAATRQILMLLDRATELAAIPFGVLGFDDQESPILIRPLGVGLNVVARRRIAGMNAAGGTRMFPALHQATQLLASIHSDRKVLLLAHDGRPRMDDWEATARLIRALPRDIVFQPVYLGIDESVIAANTALFGHVLACANLDSFRTRLCAWLRALC